MRREYFKVSESLLELCNPGTLKRHTAMTELRIIAPLDEQKICVTCGFCCDGTLFLHAHLNSGERGMGRLPGKIEEASFSEDGKDYFRLPCHYFSEKCTIYDWKRADVCGSYRCQVLQDYAERKVTLDDASETVREVVGMRTAIIKEYRRISENGGDVNFRQLLVDLGKIMKSATEESPAGMDYDMLLARCNILEALLIKHFRSAEAFEKMIMK